MLYIPRNEISKKNIKEKKYIPLMKPKYIMIK